MARLLIRRLMLAGVTLVIISAVVFGVTEVLPGDAAGIMLGQDVTDEARTALRRQLGLDKPGYQRYASWVAGVLRGDLGTSLRMQVPVGPLVWRRLQNSMMLAGTALLVGVPLALMMGVIGGLNRNRPVDHAVTVSTLILVSLPEFVVAALLILLFTAAWPVLPPSSPIDPDASVFGQLQFLVLPTATLVLTMLAYVARMTRASMARAMDSDYVRAAILRGLPRRRVVLAHALPNALVPTITIIAMNIGWMIGGLVVIETVFGYPGLGRLMIYSIENRDLPLLQAVSLVAALVYAVANLLADLLYAVCNPRIRLA
jgi:peptide/nickel transport system permease protein